MSIEYLIPHKHTQKTLCKSKHFPRRYNRKREWVFFLNTVYMYKKTNQFIKHCKGDRVVKNIKLQFYIFNHSVTLTVFYKLISIFHIL